MIDSVLARARAATELAVTDPAAARRLAAEVLRESALRESALPEAVSVAHRALGLAFTALDRFTDAERHLRTAVGVAERAGVPAAAGEARGSLAYALALTGRSAEALRVVERGAGTVTGGPAARLHMQRGLVLSELSRFDDALSAFGDALRTLRAAGGDDLLEAAIRTNRSIVRVQRRDWRGAESDLTRAEQLYTITGHSGRTAMVYHNRGLAAAVRGDVPAALAAFDEAEKRYRAAGRGPGLLPIEKAETLLSVRLVAEARAAAEQAVEAFAGQRNVVDLVQARLVLARAALLDGDPESALQEAERARRSASRQRRPGWAAMAGYVALHARWSAGHRTEAMIRTGRRTSSALYAAGWSVAALDARLIVAQVALDLGHAVAARRQLAAAAPARRSGPAELRARAWHATALLRMADGDRRGADVALRAGVRVLDRFRAGLGAVELRTEVSGHGTELADLGVRLAVRSGRPEAVLAWAERWRAGAARLPAVRPPDDAGLAGELSRLRQVAVALTQATDATTVRALTRRQATIEQAIRAHVRHTPGGDAATGPPNTEALTVALGQSTLVEYLTIAGTLHAVVISPSATRSAPHQDTPPATTCSTSWTATSPDPRAGNRDTSDHRDPADHQDPADHREATGNHDPAANRDPADYGGPTADRGTAECREPAGGRDVAGSRTGGAVSGAFGLSLHTLGPVADVERALDEARFVLRALAYRLGSERSLARTAELATTLAARLDTLLFGALPIGDGPLVLVPTGALHLMPWALLPTCADRSFSVAPSAALWHRAATAAPRTGRSVLAAGPDLAAAPREIADLARRYPDAVRFTGKRATAADVLAALDGAGLAHLAAHGTYRADNPLFSALRLADGPLTVYDLQRLARPPEHVVLSACESALASVRAGDELLGLTSAMLGLGTRSLIASVLPVPDEATRPLMLRMHRHLRAGRSPAEALADTRAGQANRPWDAERVAAAGFACFGAG